MRVFHFATLSFLIGASVWGRSVWASEPANKSAAETEGKATFLADQCALFNKADTNFDGKVSEEEAVNIHFSLRKKKQEKRFKQLDKDNNGYMSENEMTTIYEQPPNVKEDRFQKSTQRLLKQYDQDGNGYISETEIYSYYEKQSETNEKKAIKRAQASFKKLDSDASGAVSLEEYIDSISPSSLAKAQAERVERGMYKRDLNNDGSITLTENEEFLEKLFSFLDKDGNQILSVKEQGAFPYHRAKSYPFK